MYLGEITRLLSDRIKVQPYFGRQKLSQIYFLSIYQIQYSASNGFLNYYREEKSMVLRDKDEKTANASQIQSPR